MVVSGLPNITPIFIRNWLIKITVVPDFCDDPVSLRRAWDISRACKPTWESPISPSSSALGTSAATESITTRSRAPLRTSVSVISRASSPESGCETSKLSISTPSRRAKFTSSACSASMKAAVPVFCAWETMCNASMVLPAASGPKSSMTRPLGTPPTPRAASSEMAPVEMTSTSIAADSPNRMMAPLPNCRSIWASAKPIALSLSSPKGLPLALALSLPAIMISSSRVL